MLQTAILGPVLVVVALTFLVLLMLPFARTRYAREARVPIDDQDMRLGRIAWSERATKLSNNYSSQFELPVLFYAAAAFAMLIHAVNGPMLVLAWIFAIARIAHALEHIGPNRIPWRLPLFVVGVGAVLGMWVLIALRVLVGV